jgi:hypothetical protein
VERATTDVIAAVIGQTGYHGTLFLSAAGSGKDTHIVVGGGRDLKIGGSASATAVATATTAWITVSAGSVSIPNGTFYVASTVGIGVAAAGEALNVQEASAGTHVSVIRHTDGTTPLGIWMDFSTFAGDLNQYLFRGDNSAGACAYIYSEGTFWTKGTVAMVVQAGDPSTVTDAAHVYTKDVSTVAEVFVRDEAGNVTQISPHDPETGEWYFYSENEERNRKVTIRVEKYIKASIKKFNQLAKETGISGLQMGTYWKEEKFADA